MPKLAKVFFSLFLLIIVLSYGFKFSSKNDATFILTIKDKFTYQNLSVFLEDSLDWVSPTQLLIEVDSALYAQIWKNGAYKKNCIGTDYFYSWQETNNNRIEFTILTFDECDYCIKLNYHIFDNNGDYISSFLIAASCGDGGWEYTASGEFKKNNQYILTSCEKMYDYDSQNKLTTIEGDSLWTQTIILKNGQLKTKDLFKKSFTTVKKN